MCCIMVVYDVANKRLLSADNGLGLNTGISPVSVYLSFAHGS